MARRALLGAGQPGDFKGRSPLPSGTYLGPLQGIEPTGRKVEIHVIDIVRVADGKIVEHWNCVDRLGLLAQLGALPDVRGARVASAAAWSPHGVYRLKITMPSRGGV